MRHRRQRWEMALQGARLAGVQHRCNSLYEQSPLWQAPHLSCQLSPFLHKNQCMWGMAEWSSTNSHLFNRGCVKKWEKRKRGNWEELAVWNMEWFETEIASWILNSGRCLTEPWKPSHWKCCESHLALQAEEFKHIRNNRLKAGYFLLNFVVVVVEC